MYTCSFIRKYASPDRVIRRESPEIRFIERICSKDPDCAAEFFTDETACCSAAVLDAPQGRFEGLENIRKFCAGWLNSFKAVSARVIPVVQTQAGERSATEMVVRFDLGGREQEIPMMVVGDLRTDGKMEGMRIYFWWNWVEGFSPYRAPAFTPTYTTPGELALLTGYMREYYAMLHNPNTEEALPRIMNTMEEDVEFGGYEPEELEQKGRLKYEGSGKTRREILWEIYRNILSFTPKNRNVRFETIIDNGKTCVIEWVLPVNPIGIDNHSASQSGVAAYDRGPSGKLSAIRICDNLQPESEALVDFEKDKVKFFVTAYPHEGYGWLK